MRTIQTSAARGGKSGKGGTSVVTGTDGNDTLRGTTADDVIDGLGGADSMSGGSGNDVYHVDNSGDSVIELAGEGIDEVRSTITYSLPDNVENLTLVGTAAVIGNGNDLDNYIVGSESANSLRGHGGNDFIVGGGGSDFLNGGTGYDHLDGGAGGDTYVIDNPLDLIIERTGGGNDTVHSSIDYQLSLELENLTLIGDAAVGAGNYLANRITGNAVANRLDGHEGNDRIDGGAGNDLLIGGIGADLFLFSTTLGTGNVDSIQDFEAGVDRFALDDAVFAGLAPGALAAGAFHVGSAAADADDRIVYDPATGALLFDADGSGSGAAIQFATVQMNLDLAYTDFTIV